MVVQPSRQEGGQRSVPNPSRECQAKPGKMRWIEFLKPKTRPDLRLLEKVLTQIRLQNLGME